MALRDRLADVIANDDVRRMRQTGYCPTCGAEDGDGRR